MMRRSALSFEDTVRSRLLRLAVLLLLPGLSLAAMVTWQGLNADRAALDGELHASLRLLSTTIDGQIGQTEAILHMLAASDSLTRGDMTEFALLAETASRSGARIVLRDVADTWLVDSGVPQPGAVQRAAPHVATPWETRETGPAWVGWGLDPVGRVAAAITVPVRSGGRHVYNLIAFVPQSWFQMVLLQLPLRDGWFGSVYDDSLRLRARNIDAERFLGHPAPAQVAEALRDHDRQVGAAASLDGGPGQFVAERTPRFDVPVSVVAHNDLVEVPARLSLLLLVAVGGGLVALGLLGALVVSGSISRPIEALAAAARRLGESESLPPIPGGLIEADEVARAMSIASATLIERRAALSDMNVTLAARVADRTAELADANRALEDERARLGLVLDHIRVGVLVTQRGGVVMYANFEARRLIGFGEDLNDSTPVEGVKLRRNGAPVALKDAPAALAWRGTVTEREILSVERGDGLVVELEVSAGPVFDREGRVALAVTTFQEISERLAAEEARRRSQRLEAVGQLTGGVAHEFNNLLMAIGGCLDLLTPHVRGERARSLLENAARAADRGATLTKQLLAFARRQHLQTEPVDLNALVVGLAELLGTTLGRGITVTTDLATECWPAMADATQLELVLLNLAINARDAMHAGGSLVIGTGNEVLGAPRRAEEPPAGEYAVLRVSDNGSGMTPEILARAFEPFFTTKQVGRGSGLGLPHVLGVAQQLGGGVIVETQPEQGTSVCVFLPRASSVPQKLRRSSLLPPRPRALDGLRVLLVDDDIEVREIARAMLEEMGALVLEAATAREALLMLRTEQEIDLVLADYTMPHMTGAELARQMHALLPDVPVVLMTGYSATTLGDMGPPVRAVLQKPFRAETMAHVMTQVLSGGLSETA